MMIVTPHERLRYFVSSEANPKRVYLVDLLSNECGCIDFGVRHRKDGTDCKHCRAAKRFFADEVLNQIRSKMRKEPEGP